MRVTILVLASCLTLTGCGMDSNAPTSKKLTTVDQIPPECVRFFKKFSGCNKKTYDVLIGSFDPKDNNAAYAAQCEQREAETPATPGCD